MNDEEKLADELRRIAASVRAPESAYESVGRAASAEAARRGRVGAIAWQPRLAFAVAALAVIAFVASLTVFPAPATAGELLQRAERAAQTGSQALQSYRGTTKGENWMSPQGRAATPVAYEQKIAFLAPHRFRIETTVKEPSGATGTHQLFFDGNAAWLYVPEAKVAQPIDPRMVLQQQPFAPSTLAGALEALSQGFDAKQLPDDTVLGRRAHVLELVPKVPKEAGPVAKITTWLDAETLLQLGADVREGAGQLLMTWRFVALEVNVEIAPSEFSFTPPPGVRVGQILPPGATAPLRAEVWKQLASQVSFQLFRPFCGVEGLEEGMPQKDDRGIVLLPFLANGAPVLVMAQGLPTLFPAASGEKVTIGDIAAIYRAADGRQTLDFERSGTRVHVEAPAPLGKEPLFHLAVSLVPVPKP